MIIDPLTSIQIELLDFPSPQTTRRLLHLWCPPISKQASTLTRMEMAKASDGVGALEGGTLAEEVAESVLAEDQGEVHDFEGNTHDD